MQDPRKRVQRCSEYTFANAQDICEALRHENADTLSKALRALHLKLSVWPDEAVSPQDGRLQLVKTWLEVSPGAQDVFDAWERAIQPATITLLISILSSTLQLLSSHMPYHQFGLPVIKVLLSAQRIRRLGTYLGGSHNDLILATLKLFNAMSTFGSGRERKAVFDAFPWDNKTLPKLLHMRRRGKGNDPGAILSSPDIRTLYVLFIISFINRDAVSALKTHFLEQHREVFISTFKCLYQDPYPLVQRVLQVCWEGLWLDQKVKRTLKIGVFGETTISHLVKLYDRAVPEKEGGLHVPADVVHHFLLAICARPGQGICFQDHGWYPRETDESFPVEEDLSHRKGATSGRIYNKILTKVLPTLKVNEDPRQQELALKILLACPELVTGYWPAAALTFEPRLSTKWIANVSFAGQVVSQPVPVSSFLIPGATEYNPTPPPLATIIANIFPGAGTKVRFTKGLQSGVGTLVQHCTALTLAKSLKKMITIMHTFKTIATTLEEDEDEGQWSQRRKEIEKEARRRVPDFQVIVAFSQQYWTSSEPQNTIQHALLGESSQRLLWLYQECLSDLVREARFEVGKLVLTLAEDSLVPLSEHVKDRHQDIRKHSPLRIVKQLHVLRLLNASDQFTWSGKIASSSRTYFEILVKTLCNTTIPALSTTLHRLLRHILSESVLFQEDPDEVQLWLASLPSGSVCRGSKAEAPDGTSLTDEVDSVVTFLDDCTQRCLKTPYRYMEAKSELLHPNDNVSRFSDTIHLDTQIEVSSSPLLMAVLEQLVAKVNGQLISPSEALSMFTFVRRLVVKLASKQADVSYRGLRTFIQKLQLPVENDGFFRDHPSISRAIRRELSIAEACLGHLGICSFPNTSQKDNSGAGTFLDRFDQVLIPDAEDARMTSAYELVDWLRLTDIILTSAEISRLASIIQRFHHPTLKTLLQFLHPSEGQMWESDVLEILEDLRVEIDFDLLFYHCSETQLGDAQCRVKLLRALFAGQLSSLEVERAIRLVLRYVAISQNQPRLTRNLLLLLSDLLGGATTRLNKNDMYTLKVAVLMQSPLWLSVEHAPETHEALQKLICVAFDPMDVEDRKLLTPVTTYWATTLKQMFSSSRYELRFVKPWIKFMALPLLLDILGLFEGLHREVAGFDDILEEVLSVFHRIQFSNIGPTTEISLERLLRLRTQLPESLLLENMIAVALTSELPVCYDGLSPSPSSSAVVTSRFPRGNHLTSVRPDLISEYLSKEVWTDSTAKVISTLLYAHVASSNIFASWLNGEKWEGRSIDHVAITLAAFLDSSQSNTDGPTQIDEKVLNTILEQLFSGWPVHGDGRLRRLDCICFILQRYSQKFPGLSSAVQLKFQALPIEKFGFEVLHVTRHVLKVPACELLATGLLDRALRWTVRHFSNANDYNEDSTVGLEILRNISGGYNRFKLHLVEPVMTVIIKSHLHDPNAVELTVFLVKSVELKPVVVNRLLQGVLQHENFPRLLGNGGSSLQKNAITSLLVAIFHLRPANTPSYIEPLVHAYGGTLSPSDRRLLYIMRLFEAEKHTSVSPFFSQWSPSSDVSITNILEVVQNLDPIKVLRTCLFFPAWRRLGDGECASDGPNDEHMYDPVLIASLSAQMFVEYPPTTALGWVKVFRTNVVSLLIRCLSSKDANIRATAACQLALVWDSIQKSEMQEKSQVLYVLRLLKNTMHPTSNHLPRRLPTYTTLVFLHALRGIFYPSNFIYPRTSRFLLQRPELDIGDVPMLFSMLYSSSDEWKKERGWIIRMLADGMVSTADWRVLKRRHTWDLLASLFQSSQKDKALRAGILEILANLTSNHQACTSLVLKSALLSWIEMQLMNGPDGEAIAWIKILENVVVIADVSKLQRSTNGEWFAIICRSLVCILRMSGGDDIGILCQLAMLVLRLGLIRGVPKHHLHPVLGNAVVYLKRLEPGIQFRGQSRSIPMSIREPSSPPHRGQGLRTIPTITNSFLAWGKIVEAFWRVSMALDHRTPAWETLTSKLLMWRGTVGEHGSPIGEWVRKEGTRILWS